jgi:transposase-like protein
MQIMSKHYPIDQRERAVKMVLDHLGEYRSVYAAAQAIGPKVGVGPETLRKWALQPQVDAAQSSPRPSSNGSNSWSVRTEISRRPTRF